MPDEAKIAWVFVGGKSSNYYLKKKTLHGLFRSVSSRVGLGVRV